MADQPGDVSSERPVILGSVGSPVSIPTRRGGPGKVSFGSIDARRERLETRFQAAADAFDDQVQLAQSLPAADPQLVLVLEARDERIDLLKVAEKLNIEVLIETESGVAPDEEFELLSDKATPVISSCLHAVCINQRAMTDLLVLWRAWKDEQALGRGFANMRELFLHLKDVRPWGPQDRLKMVDWDEHFATQLPHTTQSVDIELWFRRSSDARATAEAQVRQLIADAGGTVADSKVIEAIGYHALKCDLPIEVVAALAQGQFDQLKVIKSANVMYLRISGQVIFEPGEDTVDEVSISAPAPTGGPVVCLLDGLPATNHPLLDGRVNVFDPDDIAAGYNVDERRHGTFMASAIVWGDRGRDDPTPSARPIFVRPIMEPSPETRDRTEELPTHALAPDLMWRAFRDLFEPGPDGTAPAAPNVAVVNLSVGDPATPFDTVMSSWARMIDWLSYEYGVLVIVSAGNHLDLNLNPTNSTDFVGLDGDERQRALMNALHRRQNDRRLISPAEAINAITVGAIHDDLSGITPQGYQVDPAGGGTSVSPVTSIGSGYRRSLKPDVAAPGGRVMFVPSAEPSDVINFGRANARGPGIKVASPANARETYTVGTSVAAALVTRQASALCDLVDDVSQGTPITRRQRAAAIKALLVHGTSPFELPSSDLSVERAVGNGLLIRNFADGCESNEAVLLFLGQLGATEEQELILPLPDGLTARETKRIDASLAWLSPINWRHRQYRRAALSFLKPAGAIPTLDKPAGLSTNEATAGAATVQHQSWETEKSFGSGRGSALSVKVKCYEQADGLDGELIDYAAVVSLWVAPGIGVDVYAQVRDQVRARVGIQPA